MSRAGSSGCQREFSKLFSGLSGRYSKHEIWKDFVWMTACAISNAVDNRFYAQREARYLETVRKYTKEEADVFPTLFALIVNGMEENPDQDFLGELYMNLEMGNSDAGQFFTPYDVCRCMTEITIEGSRVLELINTDGYISLNDPACGAGATLVSAANTLRRLGVNYQQCAMFIAQDIDYTVGLMCYIQLSLLGCPGYVKIGNTLTDPLTGRVLFGNPKDENIWYTPMFFSDRWSMLRAADSAKRIISAVATGSTRDEEDKPSVNIVDDKRPLESDLEPIPEPKTAPAATPESLHETEEPNIPLITVKKAGRGDVLNGQLMFDLLGDDK